MAAMTIQEAQALATRQLQAGRLADAEAIYRQILAVRPDHADTLHMLGVALHQSGRHAEAMELIRRAIAINPNQADYHANLGVMLGGQNRLDEAIASVQTAIGLRPDAPESHLNLGNLFRMKGRMGEAIAEYQKTVALRPNYADAYNNLGGALKDSGRFDEAIAAYRQAVALRPDPRISSNLAYLVHFLPDSDRRQILEEHRRWSEAYAKPVAPLVGPHENNPDPDRRLRVGYVSPDFREHPVGRFLLPLLSHHDHSRFEIFCYSDVGRPDAVTNCIRSHTDVWRQTLVASDEQLAQLVRQDQIDLLVDLSLHMSGHRLLAFARKPAPVQVTYLAYCSTSGVHAIDYRISDPYLDPPGTDETCYTERTLRLPRTYWCYEPAAEAPEVGPLPALAAGHVTFGCLNTFRKVTPATLDAWRTLLSAVPGSRLILHAHEGSHRETVRERFAADGIDPNRIEFTPFLPLSPYFALYSRIDIALDPFPYTGGTTTCDALWMGVPVISVTGKTAVSRGGLSILSNLGHPDWVASTPEDYIRIAADLSADLPRLAQIRSSLRERMRNSPLMDAPQFARDMEAAYRMMWREWCRSQRGEAGTRA